MTATFYVPGTQETDLSKIIMSLQQIAAYLTKAQLAFPATQVDSTDANTLDDYEEGTATPTLTFGGGSTGITYSAQTLKYTKIGNLVFCNIIMVLTSKGSDVGGALVNGLPFTAGETTAMVFNLNNGAAAVTTQTTGAVLAATTTAVMQKFAAGALTNLADTDFANNSIIRIVCVYRT